MKALKKIITLLTVAATVGLSSNAYAVECTQEYQGCGYAESCECPSLVPALAIGAVAIVAIVAVAAQNNSHGSSHGHSH